MMAKKNDVSGIQNLLNQRYQVATAVKKSGKPMTSLQQAADKGREAKIKAMETAAKTQKKATSVAAKKLNTFRDFA